MCNAECIEFGMRNLIEEEIKGKSVIEVGSIDINGSLRPFVESLCPASYIGIDLTMGLGVDVICDAYDMLERFGDETFDILISTELLEHVLDWRRVISNFKRILKPGGIMIITTRSLGFRYHGYPFDFWRYEVSDMQAIFSDFIIEKLEKDYRSHGVHVKAIRHRVFFENDLSHHSLYSMVKRKHLIGLTKVDLFLFNIRYSTKDTTSSKVVESLLTVINGIWRSVTSMIPAPIKRAIKKILGR